MQNGVEEKKKRRKGGVGLKKKREGNVWHGFWMSTRLREEKRMFGLG